MKLCLTSLSLLLVLSQYQCRLSVADLLKLPDAVQPDIIDSILDSLVDALPRGAAKALLLNSLNNKEIEQSVKKNANSPPKPKSKKKQTDQRQVLGLAENALGMIQVAQSDVQDVKDEIEKMKLVFASGALQRTFGSNLFPDKDVKKEDKSKAKSAAEKGQIPIRRRPGVRGVGVRKA